MNAVVHLSEAAKSTIQLLVGATILGIVAASVNAFTIENEYVDGACFVLALFVGNMALALPAHHVVRQSAGKSDSSRAAIASGLVAGMLVLLMIDFSLMYITAAEYLARSATAIACFLTGLVWIGAFVLVWRPFIDQAENRFIAASVSFALGCVAIALFFAGLFAEGFLKAAASKISFVQFALACVSFASVATVYLSQRETQAQRKLRQARIVEEVPRVEIREFYPGDLAAAERFAGEGMHLDRYAENRLEAWLHARDVLCGAIARSTHLYGAYEGDRLTGFLLLAQRGADRPYARSRYALYHSVFSRILAFGLKGEREDDYDSACRQMHAELDPVPDVEIVLFATDPEHIGKGVGSTLLTSIQRDFKGKLAYLFTDDECAYQFYERRGFARVGVRDVPLEAPNGTKDLKCMLYMKRLLDSCELS